MTEGYFDIILFAMVAAFLVLRLRSVLGRRTGNERRRDGLARGPRDGAGENVVSLPERNKPGELPAGAAPGSLAAGLAAIHQADPSFDEQSFVAGARQAFEMVVGAFAAGDRATLRPLLSDEVYERFDEAISNRLAAKETHETRLVSLKPPEIVAAELGERGAVVIVRFISDQVNLTRAADGTLVDGDPERVVEKTDFWTFARQPRSPDPNWLLVATRSA